MDRLPELLGRTLRDFCHVEWWEVDELAELVRSGRAKFDVPLLRAQFDEICASNAIPIDEINLQTLNEFDSDLEAREWLEAIRARVFY